MIYFLVFLFFAGHLGYSQTLNIDWEKKINKKGSNVFIGIIEDLNGGFTIIGYTHQAERVDLDYWMIRFSSDGNLLTENAFGTTNDDLPSDISQFSTGDYIIIGESVSNEFGSKPLFLMVDFAGNEIWKKNPEIDGVTVNNVLAMEDNTFVTSGTKSIAQNTEKIWLAEFDISGEILWEKTFGENGITKAISMKKLPDGGFIMAAQSLKDNIVADGDLWMARFDNEGNKLWGKNFESENVNVLPECVCCSSDSNFMVVGWYGTCMNDITSENPIFDYDLFLSKVSPDGDIIWTKNIDSEGSEGGNAIVVRPDGKILIAGRKETSFLGRVGSWLVLADQDGSVKEEIVFPFNFASDQAAEIINSSDGGFVLIGPGKIDLKQQNSNGWIKKFKAF